MNRAVSPGATGSAFASAPYGAPTTRSSTSTRRRRTSCGRHVAVPVLRHRIVTNFNAEAEGVRSDTIVKKLIDYIPRQQYDELDAQTAKMLKDQPAA